MEDEARGAVHVAFSYRDATKEVSFAPDLSLRDLGAQIAAETGVELATMKLLVVSYVSGCSRPFQGSVGRSQSKPSGGRNRKSCHQPLKEGQRCSPELTPPVASLS